MKYSDTHEWVKIEDGVAYVGISKYAQEELGEIVYVDLPSVGSTIHKGDEVAVLESTKAAADIYAPVSGTITKINEQLADSVKLLNAEPDGKGWLFVMDLANEHELDTLHDPDAYHANLK